MLQLQIQNFLAKLLTTDVFTSLAYLQELYTFYSDPLNIYIKEVKFALARLFSTITAPSKEKNMFQNISTFFIKNFKVSLFNLCAQLSFKKKKCSTPLSQVSFLKSVNPIFSRQLLAPFNLSTVVINTKNQFIPYLSNFIRNVLIGILIIKISSCYFTSDFFLQCKVHQIYLALDFISNKKFIKAYYLCTLIICNKLSFFRYKTNKIVRS